MSRTYTTEQAIAAFWNKVDKSGGDDACWNWIASRQERGYGQMRWQGKLQQASRISYELANGVFPAELEVLHSCDNPPCVNPKHLLLGTHRDNMVDRERKGRNVPARGENHGLHKLSDAQVVEIRQRFANGNVTILSLSLEFHVSKRQIQRIVNKESRAS